MERKIFFQHFAHFLVVSLMVLAPAFSAFAQSPEQSVLSDQSAAKTDDLLDQVMERIENGQHVLSQAFLDDEIALVEQLQGRAQRLQIFRIASFFSWLELQEESLIWANRLIAEARLADDRQMESLGQIALAYANGMEGGYQAALGALEIYEEEARLKNKPAAALYAGSRMAALYPVVGQMQQALEILETGFVLLDAVDDEQLKSFLRLDLLNISGYVMTNLDDVEGAARYYLKALDLADQIEVLIDGETILFNLATTAASLGDTQRAVEIYQRFLSLLEGRERSDSHFYVYYGLAEAYHFMEDYEQSVSWADKAFAALDANAPFSADLAMTQAQNLIALDRLEAAKPYIQQVRDYIAQNPELEGSEFASFLFLLQSQLEEAQGQYEAALTSHIVYTNQRMKALKNMYLGDLSGLRMRLDERVEEEQAKRLAAESSQFQNEQRLKLQRLWLSVAVFAALIASILFVYQKRMNKALKQSRARAEAANVAKSNFLAQVSHELKTPLNAIIGFSEMAANEMLGPLGNDRYREHAKSIHQAGHNLLSVINDILDLSYIGSWEKDLDEQRCKAENLIAEALQKVQSQAKAKEIALVMADMSSPHQLSSIELLIDRHLVCKALLNLLSNAVKFSPPRTEVRITTALLDDGAFRLCIEDEGIGMSERDVERALQPFGQIQNVFTRNHEGAGLGLPLSVAYLDRHDGSLGLQSQLAEGTKACVTLPPDRVFIVNANADKNKTEQADIMMGA
ncbi:HAMP domain-containing sensor histidine kinase [Iodidimonas sp. MBR-14]|uniref:ATP-binding protein n=3 Tax=unclassified Iodidimonas TaxID=2626145 RepID=UPI002482C88F|nr:HAMP domain-containing sensor histidine kinase [Iodidimonas sp. MBR-14]